MHITVHCPSCGSKYQLDPAMRGRRMRCPNSVCREVFEVREDAGTPARPTGRATRPDEAVEPPARAYSTGQVGDEIPLIPLADEPEATLPLRREDRSAAVPILSAEMTSGPPARAIRSWDQPPPVRRPGAAASRSSEQPDEENKPSESATALVEPPSVSGPVEAPAAETDPADALRFEEPLQRRRWSSLAAVMMLLLGLGVIGGGAWFAWTQLAATEEKQAAEARRDYDDGKFAAAGHTYRQLEKAFPKSESADRYRFFAHLSEVRDVAHSLKESTDALQRLEAFLEAQRSNPLLHSYRVDVWQTVHRVLNGLIEKARTENSPQLLEKSREVLVLSREFRPSDVADTLGEQAEAEIAKIAAALARREQRDRLLITTRKLKPTPDNLKALEDLMKANELLEDPEFKAVLVDLRGAVRRQVTYVSTSAKLPLPAEPVEPCLLVASLLGGPVVPPTPNGRVVPAVVRGVLYGLDQGSGRVHWAMRVGIDTASVPVRLPATASTPEIFLVLSAERNTLRAVEAQSGEPLWEHRLSAPCLGRPILIQRRAYLPLVDGRIEELEIIKGHQLGAFLLPNQRLTAGGVWQPDTDLLYVPGDSQTVYVLDVVKKQCVAVLDTGHPAGSLRGAPVLVNRIDPTNASNPEHPVPSAYLILPQMDGLGAMKLRVFEVNPDQQSAIPALTPEPRVRGWSWFPAYQDGEKLAFVSDVGILALYGINQVRNADRALFPELREEFQLGRATERPQRAQVVHAGENDFWVLANGELQRLHLDRFAQKVEPIWRQPLLLGTPLHEGQADETGKVLFVTSQTDQQQTCLATAIRAEDGQVLWQRQLGVECLSEPVPVGKQVIAWDQGGSLFAFDPERHRDPGGAEWVLGGQLLAKPLPGGARWTRTFVGQDGQSVVVVAASATSKGVVVRRIQPGAKDQKSVISEERAALRSALAGPPAVNAEHILLPLKDGSLYRIPLSAVATGGQAGPDWRSGRAEDEAIGFVTWVNAEECVTTDGLGGCRRWRWRAGDVEWKPEGQYDGRFRIVSPPVVLPNDQLCVADSQGGLTLLQGSKLKKVRAWAMEGRITNGPFARGDRLGCVMDRRRLVWIDPAEQVPLWEYATPGEGIVGQPQLIGKHLLLADQSGRFTMVDAATGRPLGEGHALKANVAPTTAPVPYGPAHALVPLTDGTFFLLPLGRLSGRWPTLGPDPNLTVGRRPFPLPPASRAFWQPAFAR